MPAQLVFNNKSVSLKHDEVDIFVFLVLNAINNKSDNVVDIDWLAELKRLWIDSVEHDPNNIRNLYLDTLLSDSLKRDLVIEYIDNANENLSKYPDFVPIECINSMIFDSFWYVSKDLPKDYFLNILSKMKNLLLGHT